MRDLTPFDFEPKHQPLDTPVTFKLRPLDMQGLYELQASMNRRGIPGWDGIVAAARYITGWTGPGEYSPARKREILDGAADANWMIWLAEIAGKLFLIFQPGICQMFWQHFARMLLAAPETKQN